MSAVAGVEGVAPDPLPLIPCAGILVLLLVQGAGLCTLLDQSSLTGQFEVYFRLDLFNHEDTLLERSAKARPACHAG